MARLAAAVWVMEIAAMQAREAVPVATAPVEAVPASTKAVVLVLRWPSP